MDMVQYSLVNWEQVKGSVPDSAYSQSLAGIYNNNNIYTSGEKVLRSVWTIWKRFYVRNVGGGEVFLFLNLSTSLENVCVCMCVCACVEMASGLLYFKKNSRVGLSSWKLGFFRLIDGTLHQFGSEVRETHTHTHTHRAMRCSMSTTSTSCCMYCETYEQGTPWGYILYQFRDDTEWIWIWIW